MQKQSGEPFCYHALRRAVVSLPAGAYLYQKERVSLRAASRRDLYAPNRIFFPNTAAKCHGRRQPCRGIFSCLAKKPLALECFAVLNRRFFFAAATGSRRNTWCIARLPGDVAEEKIHLKPCKSLCESAQRPALFFFIGRSRFSSLPS